MNILLFGRNGQVGWELQRALAPLGDLTALDRRGTAELCGDLTDTDGVRASISRLRPDVIVNAAAYTAVDRAEEECDLATRVNKLAPGVMAEAARETGALLVHFSTDYVFDGEGHGYWREDDEPAPINHYGASKLGGERAIGASGCRYLIFRTSWVYAARGRNFLATMENLIRQRESLSIVNDQVGAPTSAELIADVAAQALKQAVANTELEGIYHLAARGETNWYEYAGLIDEWLKDRGEATSCETIRPLASADYPFKARRPLNSRLDTGKLRESFGLDTPPWQDGVIRALSERNPNLSRNG